MLFKRGSLVGAVILLVLLAVPTFAGQVVTSINVSNHADRVDVVVRALQPLNLSPFASSRGAYVGFEVPARYIAKGRNVILRTGGIYSIRYGVYTTRPPRTRVVINTTAAVKYSTEKSPDGCSVTISIWKYGCTSVASAPKLQKRLAQGSDAGNTVVAPREVGDIEAPKPVQVVRTVEPEAPTTKSGNISIDFIGADINDILKALSAQSGTNIVSGPDVKGEVTVSLNKVNLEDALGYVTKLSGFNYTKSGNTYLVGSAKGLGGVTGQAGDDVVDTVVLRYANTDDVLKTIQEQIPDVKISVGNTLKRDDSYGVKGSDTAETDKTAIDKVSGEKPDTAKDLKDIRSKPAGVLVLRGSAEDVASAKDMINKIEVSVRDGGNDIVTKIYKIKYADADELVKMAAHTFPTISVVYGPRVGFQRVVGDVIQGGNTSQGTNTVSVISGDMYKVREQPTNLILTGPSEEIAKLLAVFDQVDVRQPQFLIEAKVIDINNEDEKNIGVEWAWSKGSGTFGIGTKPSYSTVDVEATVNLMVTNNKARILANPKVAIISGKPARIFIGDEVRYVSSVTLGPSNSSQTTDVVPVGILLDVVGEVGANGDITMYLHPEVSTITKFVAGIPQVARRYTDSTIRVKDGQTIIIGGLIKEEDVLTMSKIPLLADLPFLGRLFKNTDRDKIHSEVAVMITASVIPD